MMTSIRAAVLGLLAVAVLALSACSQESDSKSTVPKVSENKSSSTTGADESTNSDRPRERVDMNEQEERDLTKHYQQCLVKHGFDKSKAEPNSDKDEAAFDKAERACRSEKALPAWELDVDNPKSEKFVHEVVKCLREKGVEYVTEASPQDGRRVVAFGGDDGDEESITKGMKYNDVCEKEVADRGVGR